jgi:RNA polymerase sigma factor (sigma-70 family)
MPNSHTLTTFLPPGGSHELRSMLILKYQPLILGAAQRWAWRDQDAEDIAQSVTVELVRIEEPWETFEDKRAESFIRGVARFVAWKHNRRVARLVALADALDLQPGEELREEKLPPSQEPSPLDQASRTQIIDIVQAFLRPRDYELWFAHDVEDCSSEQLAKHRKCSVKTIQRRLKKIRNRLKLLRKIIRPI